MASTVRSTWRGAIAVIALLGGIAILLAQLVASDARQSIEALSETLGELPGGGRLAGVKRTTVLGGVSPDVEKWPTRALELLRRNIATNAHTRDEARFDAAVDVYRGAPDRAVTNLERALRTWRRDPFLLNDLAAARIALAGQNRESAALILVRAIENAVEAGEYRPSWAEPQANVQRALQALGVETAFASSASTQPVEPRTTLVDARHARDLVIRNPQTSRELLELTLFGAWADATLAGSSAREHAMSMAELAHARRDVLGDRFFADVTSSIDAADVATQRRIADAHRAYARGRSLYDSGAREAAGAEFLAAMHGFAAARSPFEYEASLQRVVVLYQTRQLLEARRERDALHALADERGYPAIAARALWLLGLIEMQAGNSERSADAHDQARRAYERLNEIENAAVIANSHADTLRIFGDTARGWMLLTRVARDYSALRTPQRQYLVLFNLSLYAQDDDLWRAAEVLQGAAVRASDRRGAILTMIESRQRRARLALRRGAVHVARADMHEASALLERVNSNASYASLAAWRDRLEAEVRQSHDPAAASAAFERLIPSFQVSETAEVPSLYVQASRAAVAAGNRSRAVSLLRRGVEFTRTRRDILRRPEYRLAALAAIWDLYQALIELEVSRDPVGALLIADEGRSALISGGEHDVDLAPASIPRVTGRRAIVYYASLRDRLIVWVVSRNGVSHRLVPYPAAALSADIDLYRRALESDAMGNETRSLGRQLFERVIQPALAAAPDAEELLIAPDGAIGDLPIATLISPQQNRPIIASFDIAFVPSLRLLASAPSRLPASAVAVGYNGNTAGERPAVTVLHAAETEAASVARLYPNSLLLVGDSANAAAVAQSVRGRDVVHIAAHAVANRFAPRASQLWLAPTPERAAGTITFDDVSAWDLRSSQLVVLSACETATGSRMRGLGAVSLAVPFLSAGARAVTGTLWKIDDRAAAPFMVAFHRRIAQGATPSAALRAAQLEALASSDVNLRSPSLWGAFVVNTRQIGR